MNLRIIAVAFALLLTSTVWAQNRPAEWIADPRTGCKIWNPYPQPNEVVSWSGPCADGYADGQGTTVWIVDGKELSRSVGTYRAGKLHGPSLVTHATGIRREGSWVDGVPQGWHKLRTPQGESREGQMKDGKTDGEWTTTYPDGTRYQTNYVNGEWIKRGTMTWTNGSTYSGDMPQGPIADGNGTLRMPDGTVFIGVWNKGCFRLGDRTATAGVTRKQCGFE